MRPVSLLIATTNAGKVREIRFILRDLPLDLKSLSDLPPVAEPHETGTTFAENAALKARYYAAASGLATVAEDSGLAIDVLGGRPGVASARYPGATYPDKFVNLYRELERHPRPWRARYVCSVAFVNQALGTGRWALERTLDSNLPAPSSGSESLASAQCLVPSADNGPSVQFACEATVEGEIAPAPRGENGFGYDPIFYYPPYGATFGELDDQRKLAVAHRGRAFHEFLIWYQAVLDG